MILPNPTNTSPRNPTKPITPAPKLVNSAYHAQRDIFLRRFGACRARACVQRLDQAKRPLVSPFDPRAMLLCQLAGGPCPDGVDFRHPGHVDNFQWKIDFSQGVIDCANRGNQIGAGQHQPDSAICTVLDQKTCCRIH
jgi:hypothetical protein